MRIISRGSCHKVVAWHGYPAYESEMGGKLIPSSIDDHAQKPPQAQLSVEVLRQMCDLDGSTGVPPPNHRTQWVRGRRPKVPHACWHSHMDSRDEYLIVQ